MCRLHGDIDALCNNANKKAKVELLSHAVKTPTIPVVQNIDTEYVALLAGDLRMERKRKAPWRNEEKVMECNFDLGHAVHQTNPQISLGPF